MITPPGPWQMSSDERLGSSWRMFVTVRLSELRTKRFTGLFHFSTIRSPYIWPRNVVARYSMMPSLEDDRDAIF